MSRRKFPIGLVAAALALASVIVASPAGAVVNGCAAPGGISMFPNAPGGQSNLKVSCILTTASAFTSQTYKVEDFPQAVWHVGAGHPVTGSTTSGSPNIVLTAGHFSAKDVNHGISGFSASTSLNGGTTPALALTASALPAGVFIKTFTDATHAVLNQNATATATGKKWTVENSDSRTVLDASTTSGSGVVTSASANFLATDVGRAISGTNMGNHAKITVRTSATQVTVAPVATATGSSQQLSIGPAASQTTARFIHDAHTTTTTTTVTSASANFQSWDTDLPVTGPGIPAGDYIKTVTNPTTVVLNAAATATSAAAALAIGAPSATAPANGGVGLNLGAELDLNPTLVAGSDDCAKNTPEGFVITGAWQNPNAYITAVFGKQDSPAFNKPTIGELIVPTAVVTFAGFIEQVPASTAGESVVAAHYDATFPLLPTGIAICSSGTAGVASTFEYLGTAQSQSQKLPSGVGTPGTTQVRSLKDITTATASSTAFLHIRANDSSTTDVFTFSQACAEQFPDVSDFGCGTG
ncbi:MAG: hypothetical protein M3Q30_17340 [Actinomycetota bacterium]|nr:hypothetical protein [Actinomycetota bacterium]